MHLPSAYAEEASVLKNATVTMTHMSYDEQFVRPGIDLIGEGFRNSVKFGDGNPFKDGSAEFQIILKEEKFLKTAMIINSIKRGSFQRFSMGSAEMWVGTHRDDMSLAK